MDGRSISREMAMRIADRELGPSSREIKIIKYVHHLESRLAAADRLAEAANQFLDAHREHCIGSLGDVEDGFDDALADYENTKKGEP